MNAEISYDLVMEDDMSFVEGTHRVGDGTWQVFIFRKDPVRELEVASGQWSSGIAGVFVRLPRSFRLNKQVVEQVMAERFGVSDWREVKGPDSMQLR
jgi:hypothetical protein